MKEDVKYIYSSKTIDHNGEQWKVYIWVDKKTGEEMPHDLTKLDNVSPVDKSRKVAFL